MTHVRITTNGLRATNGTIKIDGHDVAPHVRGFRLTAGVHEVTRLDLDVIARHAAEFEGEATVRVDPEFAEVLVGLGWTPPGKISVSLEDAQRIFDLAVDTPLVCSGSFETDDVRVLRAFAETIGVDPAKATPDEFVRDFPHPFEPFRVGIETMEIRDDSVSGGVRWETEAEVYARLGEGPDRCSAGDYNRRCARPADDPMHTAP